MMVAKRHLEKTSATIEFQIELRDSLFEERFIFMTNLTRPLVGLVFLKRNSTILDTHQGMLNFPFFSMQLKHADKTCSNINEFLLNPPDNMIQPGEQTVLYIKLQVCTEKEVTGIKNLPRTCKIMMTSPSAKR